MVKICALLLLAMVLLVPVASADVYYNYTCSTSSGATAGGQPVDASATINVDYDSTSHETVTIALVNLEVNPISVAQLMSGFSFTLYTSAGTQTKTGETATPVSVAGDGTWSTLTTSNHWGLSTTSGATVTLAAPLPGLLLIGPPGTNGKYDSKGDGSIAGNGPHNPFYEATSSSPATFTVTIDSVNGYDAVTGGTFYFGTGTPVQVAGVTNDAPVLTPEPATMALMGLGLLAVAVTARKRRKS